MTCMFYFLIFYPISPSSNLAIIPPLTVAVGKELRNLRAIIFLSCRFLAVVTFLPISVAPALLISALDVPAIST